MPKTLKLSWESPDRLLSFREEAEKRKRGCAWPSSSRIPSAVLVVLFQSLTVRPVKTGWAVRRKRHLVKECVTFELHNNFGNLRLSGRSKSEVARRQVRFASGVQIALRLGKRELLGGSLQSDVRIIWPSTHRHRRL